MSVNECSSIDNSFSTDLTILSGSSSNYGCAQDLFDWDVSPIGSVSSLSSISSGDTINPFRNSDGSYKSREQVEEEVRLMGQEYQNNFPQLVTQLEEGDTSIQVISRSSLDFSRISEPCVPILSRVPRDFPGFVDNDFVSSDIARKCRILREVIGNLNETSNKSSSPQTPLNSGLSSVLQDIREARETISKNREIAHARIVNISPPFTRSRGRVIPLPNVQRKVLERELLKRKSN